MQINGTDTSFMMISTVLVMLMTPGLALFYGGMVRRKNVINTTIHSYAAIIIGTWGALATGIFASHGVNPAGANGILYGNFKLLGAQILSICATYVYTILATYLIIKVMGRLISIRVTKKEELQGLDIALHGESAYGSFDMDYPVDSLIS